MLWEAWGGFKDLEHALVPSPSQTGLEAEPRACPVLTSPRSGRRSPPSPHRSGSRCCPGGTRQGRRWLDSGGPQRAHHPVCPRLLQNPPLTCRDTCQGQEPGTASSPLTILDRPLSTGWMAGTPQPGECGRKKGRVWRHLQKSRFPPQPPRPAQDPLPHPLPLRKPLQAPSSLQLRDPPSRQPADPSPSQGCRGPSCPKKQDTD